MEIGVTDPKIFGDNLCRVRGGFYRFVREFWHITCNEELVLNWHIKYCCELWEDIIFRLAQKCEWEKEIKQGGWTGKWLIKKVIKKREKRLHNLLINIPPGTSKSTIFVQMGFVWAWCIDPSLRILGGSYSEELAFKNALMRRDIMESRRFTDWFPDIVIRNDVDSLKLMKNGYGGAFGALGLEGTITGNHYELLVMDDPNNANASETELKSTNEKIKNLNTRAANKETSVFVFIQQRVGNLDASAHVLGELNNDVAKKSSYFHVCLPAEDSPDVKPIELRKFYKDGLLDPIRLNRDVLDDAKSANGLGIVKYTSQYLQRPAPADGIIWKVDYFQVVDEVNMPTPEQLQLLGTDWDTAETKNKENAATAWVTAGKIGKNIFIIDIGWAWEEFPLILKRMKGISTQYGGTHIHCIEAKSSGKSLVNTLRNAGIYAQEVKVTGGEDKVKRANDAVPVAANGNVYIAKRLIDKLLNDPKQGILNFPNGRYKDLADALAQSLIRLGKSYASEGDGSYVLSDKDVENFTPSKEIKSNSRTMIFTNSDISDNSNIPYIN